MDIISIWAETRNKCRLFASVFAKTLVMLGPGMMTAVSTQQIAVAFSFTKPGRCHCAGLWDELRQPCRPFASPASPPRANVPFESYMTSKVKEQQYREHHHGRTLNITTGTPSRTRPEQSSNKVKEQQHRHVMISITTA